MVRILDGIPNVGYGIECRGVQDVVDTERGEFPDISVSEATSFFDEAVFHVGR